MFVAGIVMGFLGFLPLLSITLLGREAGSKTKVRFGLVSVAVSAIFLTLFEAAVWELAPEGMLGATAGMLLGFFAGCGLLAAWTARHRS